jgi:hypothetical protein
MKPTPTASPSPTVKPTPTPSASATAKPTLTPAPTPTPTLGGGTKITIVVSPASSGTVGTDFAGFSYEKSSMGYGIFNANTPNLVGLFQRLGPSLLRIGANEVDIVTWAPTGVGGDPTHVAPKDIDNLAAFLKLAGWKVLYGLNLKTSNAATEAGEAAYAASVLGTSLWAFEVGNESDIYESEATYLANFTAYVAAIRARVPGAKFAGPGLTRVNNSVLFASQVPADILALTHHYYIACGCSATASIPNMLGTSPAGVDGVLQAAQTKNQIPQWRWSEANNYYTGGKGGVSDSFASALWVLDFLSTAAIHGGSGVNFHGGYGPQFPLHYTPIAFGTTPLPTGARPEFYAMYLFTLAGAGAAHTALVTGLAGVSAYGIGNNVLIVNKTATALDATVTVPAAPSSARQIVLTAPALGSLAGVTIGGASIALNGSVSPQATACSVSGNSVRALVPGNSAAVVLTT